MKDRPGLEEPFDRLLLNLLDTEAPLRAALIYRLSDISEADYDLLTAVWNDVPVERRRQLLSRLAEAGEQDFTMNFVPVAHFALADEDADVRGRATHCLWLDESVEGMDRLLTLLRSDPDESVRAQAAQALGHYIYAGELDELPVDAFERASAALLQVLDSTPLATELHLRALESLTYQDSEEAQKHIHSANTSDVLFVRTAAVFSMGRSANDALWGGTVLQALEAPEPELRFEAARAAGELGLPDAVPALMTLVEEDDSEIRDMSIWALGEIGGEMAVEFLLALSEKEEDEGVIELVEDALNLAMLAQGKMDSYIFPARDDDDDWEDEDWED